MCSHARTRTHARTQNKHSNPGLEKLSDDTAARIMAKTFTLLFFHDPFIFFIVFSIYSAVCFFPPLVMGTSLAGDVLTTDGGSGIHSKGKRSQGHFRQGYLYHGEGRKLNKKGMDAKQPFKRVFFTSRLFVCGIFPAHSLRL